MPQVKTGLDRLRDGDYPLAPGQRVGLLCHAASVDQELRHAAGLVTQLCDQAGARLVRLFGPEHGVRGDAQDMVGVGDEPKKDPLLGLIVVSLYGAELSSLRPRPEHLEDLDLLIIDLQDVGSRYYTYVWTLVLCMEVCAGMPNPPGILVLDRPNPLGGSRVEGPGIEAGFQSFVGLHDVPTRHGLTMGELAQLCRAERGLDLELDVLAMEGWRRRDLFDHAGLPWVLPSPNMPSLETALVYPGGCLVEGTNLSEGRGTTRPFELTGAPYIQGHTLARALEAEGLPGVRFRSVGFTPTFQKHAGRLCGGIQHHLTDRDPFCSLRTGVALLRAARRGWPESFQWRKEAYEFVTEIPAIDLLAGGTWLREGVDGGADLEELCAPWREQEDAFIERRRPFLLYPEKGP